MDDKRISEINEKLFKEKVKEMGLLVPVTEMENKDSYARGFKDGWSACYEMIHEKTLIEVKNVEAKQEAKKTSLNRPSSDGEVTLQNKAGQLFCFATYREGNSWLHRGNGYIQQCIKNNRPIYSKANGHRAEKYTIWEGENGNKENRSES